jgi:hypothetical protein
MRPASVDTHPDESHGLDAYGISLSKRKNLSLMLNYSTHGRHGEKACAAAVLGFLGLTATTTPETEREEKQKRRARGIVGAITVPAAPPMSRHGLQVENVASTTVPVRPSDGDDDHLSLRRRPPSSSSTGSTAACSPAFGRGQRARGLLH